MKKSIIVLLAVMAAGFGTEARGEGQKKLKPFHSIVMSSEIEAELILSKNEAIEVDFENASPEDVIIDVSDSILKIRMKTGKYKDAILKVRLFYKDISFIESTARANVWSEEKLYLKDISLKINNGGEVHLK